MVRHNYVGVVLIRLSIKVETIRQKLKYPVAMIFYEVTNVMHVRDKMR
jgi:hypothetical protein